MSASVNRQILLVEKPSGKLGTEHFKLSNAAIEKALGLSAEDIDKDFRTLKPQMRN